MNILSDESQSYFEFYYEHYTIFILVYYPNWAWTIKFLAKKLGSKHKNFYELLKMWKISGASIYFEIKSL